MTTGERIKALRKAKGMNAEALASACGVSPATIYRYEKGDIEHMGTDKLKPIAAALGTTPAYLMGWESNSDPETPMSDNSAVQLSNVYLSFAREAQEKNIDPADIKLALDMIRKLKEKSE